MGGAELVQLRVDDAGMPLVQPQARLEPGPDGTTWVDVLLGEAARRVAHEDFPPTPGEQCGRCAQRRSCPAQAEGRQVVE